MRPLAMCPTQPRGSRYTSPVIAVTFALPAEGSEFLRRLGNRSRTDRNGISIVRGKIGDHSIEVIHTGVGENICRERIARFLENQQFDLLISAGFAGSLNDEARIGSLCGRHGNRIHCACLRGPRHSAAGATRHHRHSKPTIPCSAERLV